jgi:hypothetical protein
VSNVNRCGGCDATWTAAAACHCARCHRTFTGLTAFDAHRAAQYTEGPKRRVKVRGKYKMVARKIETRPAGMCYDPADSGLVLRDNGFYGAPPSEELNEYWTNRNKTGDL